MRFAFAGDRDIAVSVLEFLVSRGELPVALLLSSPSRATHAAALRALCPHLGDGHVLEGAAFRKPPGIALLKELGVDTIVCIHFPYLVPLEVLNLAPQRVLNLHPALLPFNRGWHTPSWAILDGTPAGATLHLMDMGLDTGDLLAQKQVPVRPSDTANALYRTIKQAELDLFREAWPRFVRGEIAPKAQSHFAGTHHTKGDLLADDVRAIDLHHPVEPAELLRRLRALTTSDVQEAAWFEVDGRRYAVRVEVTPLDGP